MADQDGNRVLDGQELLSSLRRQWSGMQPQQRRIVALVGAIVLVGLLVWVIVASRGPAMEPLFTSLNASDAESIVTQLQQQKVPYTLEDNGATILVPEKDVANLRLSLASQGLPAQGAVGLSSALDLPFGATTFTEQVAYQQAVQNELASTIRQIKGVQGARVQIVLPQTPTFSTQSTPASAGVLVQLAPGAELSASQVQGIVHLVASSVEGLSASGVTVLDQNGTVLASGGQVGGSAAAGSGTGAGLGGSAAAQQTQSNLAVQQQFDAQEEAGLDNMLAQVFGPGNVVTQVNAELNFNSGTESSTLFAPQGGSQSVLGSLQQQLQKSVGAGKPAGGVPGTASNSFPTYTTSTASSATSSTSSSLNETFDVSKEVTDTTIAPGAVSRLSVAVVVNKTLTPAEQQLVAATVSAAVGADPARQDQISVVGIPFNESLAKALTPAVRRPTLVTTRNLVYAAVALAILVLMTVLVVGVLRRQPEEVPLPPPPAAPDLDVLDGALKNGTSRSTLERSLRSHPSEVAQVVRAWLSEEEN